MKKLMVVVFCITLAIFAGQAFAGSGTLRWDSYTDTATGFKIYGSRTANVTVTPANLLATIVGTNTVSYVKSGIATGVWYFVMTAYDAAGESDKSNEAMGTIKLSPISGLIFGALP